MNCPNCGAENSLENMFCENCGFKLKNENNPNDKPKRNSTKIILISTLIAGVVLGGFACFKYYQYIYYCKLPYNTTWTFADTKAHVAASYNDTYDAINISLTVDEVIEPWQIEEMGTNKTNIKITCETYDGLKKEFDFKNIILKPSENLKGNYSMEQASLKDFVMVKSLLKGSVNISYPEILELDNKKRNELKQAYYKRKAELKKAEQSLDALNALGGLMLFNAMF